MPVESLLTREQLLAIRKAERIDEYDNAEFLGAPPPPNSPTYERVLEWRRLWRDCIRRERIEATSKLKAALFKKEPRYPRDIMPWSLGGLYEQHVQAMTAEGLHSKGDIAEQLAWRDQQIEELLDTARKVDPAERSDAVNALIDKRAQLESSQGEGDGQR